MSDDLIEDLEELANEQYRKEQHDLILAAIAEIKRLRALVGEHVAASRDGKYELVLRQCKPQADPVQIKLPRIGE